MIENWMKVIIVESNCYFSKLIDCLDPLNPFNCLLWTKAYIGIVLVTFFEQWKWIIFSDFSEFIEMGFRFRLFDCWRATWFVNCVPIFVLEVIFENTRVWVIYIFLIYFLTFDDLKVLILPLKYKVFLSCFWWACGT